MANYFDCFRRTQAFTVKCIFTYAVHVGKCGLMHINVTVRFWNVHNSFCAFYQPFHFYHNISTNSAIIILFNDVLRTLPFLFQNLYARYAWRKNGTINIREMNTGRVKCNVDIKLHRFCILFFFRAVYQTTWISHISAQIVAFMLQLC